ncbi:MAG: carbamoyl-phosphate synthase large subunit [Clostridiales bacterium]|nr:carbamoyl-phosphate synthase large subunit [Clostridiales bacterium]
MPLDKDIKKVLVIGSGPIVIGQAAEFDYAGTQACTALKEEGVEVVLINSNPATIMTDTNMADHIYIEPLTPTVVKKVIAKEKPDSLLATLGGQTALNLAMELAESGFLDAQGVRLLGTSVDSIKKAEDREAFNKTMKQIGQPVVQSTIANDIKTAVAFADQIGYPVVVRPAYTLGGTGGGIAYNQQELISITQDGIRLSRVGQVLIEKSVAGWKEIEFEVIRDRKGNCIVVCDMENIDPVGIHTGDSIVVAPSQTLKKQEYKMLYKASIDIINSLEIQGGCNVQYAFNPDTLEYHVIEVNPRVSRSSALASKATGFPIAKVTTKIALGYFLSEIDGIFSDNSCTSYEPDLDYVVVKIPRWPFDKFVKADKTLGTRMKATGEIMAIGKNFEEALLKAERSLENDMEGLGVLSNSLQHLSLKKLDKKLTERTHQRLYIIAEAIRREISIETIHKHTCIDKFYLYSIKKIIDMEKKLKSYTIETLSKEVLLKAKKMGFSDKTLAKIYNIPGKQIKSLRKKWNINPAYETIIPYVKADTTSGEYYYSTYNSKNQARYSNNKKNIVILGSGPIRIGQGIEFDYCSVHCIWALKRMGYDTVIINNNPETVSTDSNIAHRLYFEPLTPEDVINILDVEQPLGVVVQFGGQTAIKLAKVVEEAGYKILGTSLDSINRAEDRKEFDRLLSTLGIIRPAGTTVFTADQAVIAARKLGYPVLVRPSYVLGGEGMEIAYNDDNIREYMDLINLSHQDHPVLIDKYIMGKEIEVDAISDGEDILIPGIMEHIERSGVHSGDSISVYPSQTISSEIIDQIIEYSSKLSKALKVRGLINIQYIEYGGNVYVIEVNPRSSRTVPYLSKVTGVPMIELATKASLGYSLKDMGYGTGLYKKKKYITVKVPVFSFEKLPLVDTRLGPEMKSTGEVLGIGKNLPEALYKGMLAAGYVFSRGGNVLITVADPDKQEIVPLASKLSDLGFKIFATSGTALELHSNYIAANVLRRINEDEPNITSYIKNKEIDLVINTPTKGRSQERDGFKIRRMAVEHSIPCFTTLDTAKVFVEIMLSGMADDKIQIYPMEVLV